TGVAIVFWIGAFPLTAIAAVLILFISTRRKWRLDVVAWLWGMVIFNMAMLLPSMAAVIQHFGAPWRPRVGYHREQVTNLLRAVGVQPGGHPSRAIASGRTPEARRWERRWERGESRSKAS
ncbi:MAG TPA: hypothetical protein VLF95_12705, partial [Vicinamibacteria bacterium]|nr:hypothetical protein [Vicinamibacteria bacterium]